MNNFQFPGRWTDAGRALIRFMIGIGVDEEQAAKVIDYSFAKANEFFEKPFEYDFQLDLHFTPREPDRFKRQIQNLIDSVREQTEQVIFERVFLQLIVLHGLIFLHERDNESNSDKDPATPIDTSD